MDAIVKHSEICYKTNQVVVTILFIVYPILALPFIFMEIYNKRRYAFALLAIFMGFMGLLYPPFGDFYRYVEDYKLYATCSFSELLEETTYRMDTLFPMFLWVLAKLHIPADYGRFITNWISFHFLLSIIYDIVKNDLVSNKKSLYITLIFLCFSPFYYYLPRFSFSGALFIYASYMIIVKRKRYAYGLLILSALNHFSYIVPVLFFIAYKIFRFPIKRSLILWPVLLSFIFSFDVFSPIIGLLPLEPHVVDHLFEYIDGYWANDYAENASIRFKIMSLISKVGFYFCWIYVYKNFSGSDWQRYIAFLLLLLLLCSPFNGIYGRYIFIVVLVMLFDVLYSFSRSRVKTNIRWAISIVSAIMLFINIWNVRRQLSISDELLIFAPAYTIVTHSYDDIWMNMTLDSEGLIPS